MYMSSSVTQLVQNWEIQNKYPAEVQVLRCCLYLTIYFWTIIICCKNSTNYYKKKNIIDGRGLHKSTS